jgi:hypothetical protein
MESQTPGKFVSPSHMPYLIMVIALPGAAGEDAGLNRVLMPPLGRETRMGLMDPPWMVQIQHGEQLDVELIIELRAPIVLGVHLARSDRVDLDLSFWNAPDLGVSRRHVQLKPTKAQLNVIDLGSTNGTQYNGQPMDLDRVYSLRTGDRLTLGHLPLHLRRIARPTQAGEPSKLVTQRLKETGWLDEPS